MSGLMVLLFLPAFAYQIISIAASLRHKLRRDRPSQFRPPVSILKPVRGLEPAVYAALRSQAAQRYPEFEILFGVADERDPAVPLIRQLQRDFPHVAIALHIGIEPGANAKVGTLAYLSKFARHGVWVVSDSDIGVTPEYLETITAPLQDSGTGVVTCLYRPIGNSAASRWEALGVAVDFMPSTLVAQLVGVREFGFGSTLCFRAAEFEAAGGFNAIGDYIADDFQLAWRLVQGGRKAHISSYVVETSLGDGNWHDVWQHQMRWARTIRATKGAGFAGLPITHAGLWAVVAAALGMPVVALALLGVRVAAALASGWLVLGVRRNPVLAMLGPVWDLYAFCVWAVSYASQDVVWRGRRLRIRKDGKIEER
jgi:ceramide glucosyltransferase